MKSSKWIATLVLAAALAACGRSETPGDEPAAGDQAESSADATAEAPEPEASADVAPAPADDTNVDAPITLADLDIYAEGVAREVALLTEQANAVKSAREAKDDAAEAAAMIALGGDSAEESAAAETGIEPARYRAIKAQIDDVLSKLDMAKAMQPQIAAMETADTSMFDEAQKKEMADNLAEMKKLFSAPYDGLPEDVREAFKAREPELAKLRGDALAQRLSILSR